MRNAKNWYRKGNLPDKLKDQTDIELCRNGPGGPCDKTKHVSVLKCADDKYAFQLGPLSGCPEAYCLERTSNKPSPTGQPPDISSIKPIIKVEVKRKGKNELQFYCDFTPKASTDYFYTVSWVISENSLSTHELHHSEPVRYLSRDDFREMTMMTERHLTFGLGVTIACSITASIQIDTPESVPVLSAEKFCGIRAVNASTHVHIANKKGADLHFELTIPFGCFENYENDRNCFLEVLLFIPDSDTNCNRPDISQRKSLDSTCGLRFHKSEVNKPKSIHIMPVFPKSTVALSQEMTLVLTTPQEYEAHPFFTDYAVAPIQVTVSTDQTIINNKVCYAVCDPHMMTFDGQSYENQNEGIFDMYINSEYNQKVQIQTQSCYNNGQTPFCVCGVAVQAGSDIFSLSTCAHGNLDVRFIQCGDRILKEKVDKVSESQYRVTLPSGTYVDITLKIIGENMNVQISPSVADLNTTSGLCGLFDTDITNDGRKRPGSNATDSNTSWMVKKEESLFNEDVVLTPWEDHYRFCNCNPPSPSQTEPDRVVTCNADIKKTCNAKPHFTDRCVQNNHRKRRSNNGKYLPTNEGDFHKTVKTAFVSKQREPLHQRKQRSIQINTNYTKETARRECMNTLNTTTFQKCSNIPGLDFKSTIDFCVLDAQETGTMDWTMSHLESIKSLCIQQVDIQKMPPKEDLVGITVTINGTSFSNISTQNNSLPFSPQITEDMFEEIRSVSCLRECSRFGKCDNGTCICEHGHSGEDCSLDSTRPPEMRGIPDEGVCDLQDRACKKTSVFGDNLVFDNHVKCKIKPQEINERNEVINKEIYQVTGLPQTYMEVSCQLQYREKRAVDNETDDIVARVYTISLSNDGVNFSEEDTFLVYNKACVICNRTNGAVGCQKQTGFCVTNGECYDPGDTIGCSTCSAIVDGSTSWQLKPGCGSILDGWPNSDAKRHISHDALRIIAFIFVVVGLF